MLTAISGIEINVTTKYQNAKASEFMNSNILGMVRIIFLGAGSTRSGVVLVGVVVVGWRG